LWTAGIALCLALAQGGAQAKDKTITYSDGSFAAGTWTAAFDATGTGSGISAYRVAAGGSALAGGDPAFLEIDNTSNNADIWGYAFMNSAVYNPGSLGALTGVTGSFDCNMGQENGQGVGLALEQGGKHYYAPYSLAYPRVWTNLTSGSYLTKNATKDTTWTGLTASDFRTFGDRGGDGSTTTTTTHPDFSAKGGEITFGVVNLNYAVGSRDTQSGFDNFNVTLTYVPEPAFYQLGAMLGLGGLAFLRRRRA